MNSRTERQAAFRDTIERFIKERLDAKLKDLSPDDSRRAEQVAKHAREAWLADAARRVAWIQIATHTLKPMHPDARGTNLFCRPDELPSHSEAGSHVLGKDFSSDVVGDAKALDIYKLLKLEVDGRPLLAWMQEGDPNLLSALSDDVDQATEWLDAFTGITAPRRAIPSSHTLAKQVYWLAGEDPADDGQYHLLAPLYSSALAHAVFQTINEDRFGKSGELARQARREQRDHDTGYREYPDLAVQKLGGSNKQNISQLNSERAGNNYLLASRPPKWKALAVKAPLHTDSVFPRFGRIPEVRHTVRVLREFLESDPPPNMETRNRRDALLERLIDELVDFAHPFQASLPAGWTRDANCRLTEAERLWLDPRRAGTDDPTDADFRAGWQRMDWPAEIGRRFGNWLNHELGQTLRLGDDEGRHWHDELLLNTEWADALHRLRQQHEPPTYAKTGEAVQ